MRNEPRTASPTSVLITALMKINNGFSSFGDGTRESIPLKMNTPMPKAYSNFTTTVFKIS